MKKLLILALLLIPFTVKSQIQDTIDLTTLPLQTQFLEGILMYQKDTMQVTQGGICVSTYYQVRSNFRVYQSRTYYAVEESYIIIDIIDGGVVKTNPKLIDVTKNIITFTPN